jgi:hypothetical protein
VSLPFSTSAARRRGRVSRWSSRTREAQWEEEQTADLSGAHCIFPAKTRVTILKRESVLSWWSQLFYSICRSSWKGRFGERSWHVINFLYFRNLSWKEPLEMKLEIKPVHMLDRIANRRKVFFF